MASIFEQYGIKEVADVTFYEIGADASGGQLLKPVLFIDTMKVSTIESTASTSDAKGGKANPSLISWDFGREITLTMEDALFSPKTLALIQNGGIVTIPVTGTPLRVNISNEQVTCTAEDIATLIDVPALVMQHLPIAETVYVYEIDANGYWVDGVQLHDLDILEVTGTYYIHNHSLTVGDLVVGKKYAVFYETEFAAGTNAQTIEISPDTFPGTYRVVGDTYARNRATGKDEFFQFVVHKAKMNAENTITLEAEGDPSTFNMSMRVLKDPTSGGMINLIKYGFTAISGAAADLYPSDLTSGGVEEGS